MKKQGGYVKTFDIDQHFCKFATNLHQIKDIVACKKRIHRRTHNVAIHKLLGLIIVLA